MADKPETIDAYVAAQSPGAQAVLGELIDRIRRSVPEAEETISYDIPTFKLNGKSFVHIAAWKKHISIYPIPDGDARFEQGIAPYRAGKGTLQFPMGEPLPHDLIDEVVRLLVAQRS
jgi:uncharacterized protein YdhG (YjbR/CyaY superfamily)